MLELELVQELLLPLVVAIQLPVVASLMISVLLPQLRRELADGAAPGLHGFALVVHPWPTCPEGSAEARY